MRLLLIQKNDLKSLRWSEEARECGFGELISVRSSVFLPYALFMLIAKRKRPYAICFRYLNDYPSFGRSLLRAGSELLAVVLALATKVKILWICHNVDRESCEYYPRLTSIRRRMLISVASKVFVTDDLLLTSAMKSLGIPGERISVAYFGDVRQAEPGLDTPRRVIEKAVSWIQEKRRLYPTAVVGLWIGTAADKNLEGLYQLLRLAERGATENASIHFVVIGPIGELQKTRHEALIRGLGSANNIFLHREYFDVPVESWPILADFVWKPIDDLSVSLTTYNSASAGMPLVCSTNTFIGAMVEHYKLGFAIDVETVDMQELTTQIRTWSKESAIRFLEGHTWEKGARNLFSV